MNKPDLRWEGIPHDRIYAWVTEGRGAAVTERLEARLTSVAAVLEGMADMANGVLQRFNGGEWTGNAATIAAQAVRVLRDFDDAMRHRGEVNTLAAFGQSDNASWVKANMPAVVDVRAAQIPTGNLGDVFNATVDYQHQQQAARDAEEQARQVMRDYETMTVERIAALPPLSAPPQVVINASEDANLVTPQGDGSPDTSLPPRGSTPASADGDGVSSSAHGPAGGSPGDDTVDNTDRDTHGSSRTDPSGARTSLPIGDGVGHDGETARPIGALTDETAGRLGAGGARRPPWGGGQRVGEPGVRGGTPRGAAEEFGRGRRGGSTGVVPVGAAGSGKSDEDSEHQVRYTIPGSEIFEPDNDDGVLHDPFRPGSYVVPGSIGDDDDE